MQWERAFVRLSVEVSALAYCEMVQTITVKRFIVEVLVVVMGLYYKTFYGRNCCHIVKRGAEA